MLRPLAFTLRTFRRSPVVSTRRFRHQLTALPYDPAQGLPPLFSSTALRTIWEEHQAELVEKLNGILKDTKEENLSVQELVQKCSHQPSLAHIFNVASQIWNNDFFLRSLTPEPKELRPELQARIIEDFKSIELFKQTFTHHALSLFGSGWTWLVEDEHGHLRIMNTYNAGTPDRPRPAPTPSKASRETKSSNAESNDTLSPFISSFNSILQDTPGYLRDQEYRTPLLALSLWEHAYFTDYGVRGRQAYVERFWDVVDWERVFSRSPKRHTGY
ncbi:mitochondrial 37S ribosomal protein mS42 [Calcarisporiella thermophila]|uniref:mitochondrial 37S ribosomal protein mS42 n=1 Tax=Calcarisporiella thermophila TaxID=911321 RepID=UPI003741FF3A